MEVTCEYIDGPHEGLINAPVNLIIWSRPDFLRRQFEVVKKARPKILIIVSDYGRNEAECAAIEESRAITTEIDWKCQVHRLYWYENQGLYSKGSQAARYIWERFDRCIFLEDDDIPAVSFFRFCDEMLERYKDDLRVGCICGMNSVGIYEDCSADYFFSNRGCIWGCAYWKRTYDLFAERAYLTDPYILERIRENAGKSDEDLYACVQELAEKDTVDNHVPGDEYFLSLGVYLHHQLQLVPTKNQISNIGCDTRAAHSNDAKFLPKKIQRLYNLPTYEYDFPLNHPRYVIRDRHFEEIVDDIFARGSLRKQYLRLAEIAWRKLRYGGFSAVAASVKKHLKREITVEK